MLTGVSMKFWILLILIAAAAAWYIYHPNKTELFDLSSFGIDCKANMYEHHDGSTSFKFNCDD